MLLCFFHCYWAKINPTFTYHRGTAASVKVWHRLKQLPGVCYRYVCGLPVHRLCSKQSVCFIGVCVCKEPIIKPPATLTKHTHMQKAQLQTVGKVIYKPQQQLQQMQRNVRSVQETDTVVQSAACVELFLPPPFKTDRNGSTAVSSFTFSQWL